MSPRGLVERDIGDVYGAMAMRSIEKPKIDALLLDHADDLVRSAGDAQLAADGIEVGEEVLGDLGADDDHRCA